MSLSVALEKAFRAALSDQPAGAQAIRIVTKLVRPNDCSLCDGPKQKDVVVLSRHQVTVRREAVHI